ncbi:MAG: prepilin peptidase [Oscillospiraceae bacterium]|nr:prepilin peptidase [Oscillospiraceae bacterium]
MKQNKWELRLRNCPCCNGQSKLEVEIPLFGWQGVRVKCTHCGVNVSTSQISELITRDDGISTPITEESLMKAIKSVADKWNTRKEKVQNEKTENTEKAVG